jgi:serine/threonine protein kinase
MAPSVGQTAPDGSILEQLGNGGMGAVSKAEDTRLTRSATLKFLPPDLTGDPEARERFIREAHVVPALPSNSIRAVYGFDETPRGRVWSASAEDLPETLELAGRRTSV